MLMYALSLYVVLKVCFIKKFIVYFSLTAMIGYILSGHKIIKAAYKYITPT